MKKMNNKTKDSTTSPRRIIHLRTELLLSFTLLTVVITLLLVGGVYRTGREIIRENAASAYLTGLQYSIRVLDRSLAGVEYATFPLLMDTDAKAFLQAHAAAGPYQRYQADQYLLAQLKNITIQSDEVDSAYLYYAGDGSLIGTNLSHTYRQEELRQLGWEELLASRENIRLGQWLATPSLSAPGETLVSNFKWIQANDRVLGVIVVNIKPELWDKVLGSPDSSFTMLSFDSAGRLLSQKDLPPDLPWPPEDLTGRDTDGYFDQGPYTLSCVRSEYSGWYYLRVSRTDHMLGQLRAFRVRVLPAIAAVAAATLLTMALVTAHVMHPVNVLKNAMARMGEGDLSVRIQEERRDDFQILYRGFNSMADNLDRTVQTVYLQKLEQKDMSMRILRSQINAHFLYNTLDTIRWIAVLHQEPEVSRLVTHLANYYRVALTQGRDLPPLSVGLSLIDRYLKIWEAKNDQRILFRAQLPPEAQGLCILKNILQPLVENSIQHGLDGSRPLTILFTAQPDWEAGTLTVTLRDDGKGIPPRRLARLRQQLAGGEGAGDQGFALWNINDQLKTYYGEGYGLWLESVEDSFTSVRITMPIREADQNVQAVDCGG